MGNRIRGQNICSSHNIAQSNSTGDEISSESIEKSAIKANGSQESKELESEPNVQYSQLESGSPLPIVNSAYKDTDNEILITENFKTTTLDGEEKAGNKEEQSWRRCSLRLDSENSIDKFDDSPQNSSVGDELIITLVPHQHTLFCERKQRVCSAVGKLQELEFLQVDTRSGQPLSDYSFQWIRCAASKGSSYQVIDTSPQSSTYQLQREDVGHWISISYLHRKTQHDDTAADGDFDESEVTSPVEPCNSPHETTTHPSSDEPHSPDDEDNDDATPFSAPPETDSGTAYLMTASVSDAIPADTTNSLDFAVEITPNSLDTVTATVDVTHSQDSATESVDIATVISDVTQSQGVATAIATSTAISDVTQSQGAVTADAAHSQDATADVTHSLDTASATADVTHSQDAATADVTHSQDSVTNSVDIATSAAISDATHSQNLSDSDSTSADVDINSSPGQVIASSVITVESPAAETSSGPVAGVCPARSVRRRLGPVLAGPPRLLGMTVELQPIAGAEGEPAHTPQRWQAVAHTEYIGGEEGPSEFWWFRVSADGRRLQLSEPSAALAGSHQGQRGDPRRHVITAEDEGCTLKAKCRPVRQDGFKGEIFTSKSSPVILLDRESSDHGL